MSSVAAAWAKKAEEQLVGKTIVGVRYMTPAEMKDQYWSKNPLVIFLSDGSYIYPSADDEGNDGGALFTSIDELSVIPTV